MDIPVNADVLCTDGSCGHSTYVIINPTTRRVTHVVVKEKRFPYIERLVSLDQVAETGPNCVRLQCTKDELAAMDPFIELEFLPGSFPFVPYEEDEYMTWPYALPQGMAVPLEHERIPPNELAVRRGAHVEAKDGRVGVVNEFLVDPTNGDITHLVLREGHLWGKKDVTISVSQIDHIEEDTVYLKLSKRDIEALPAVPVRRRLP